MRVAVVGGGPAGLYFSALWKRRHRDDEVRLFEQNAADATWGFGVVFSDQALEFLRDDDPDTVAAIAPHMQAWRDIAIVHRGERSAIDGVGFSAIGRLQLLQLLQRRAREAGVALQFGHAVQSLAELAGYDLIVAADGVNSLVRRTFEARIRLPAVAFAEQVRLVRHDQAVRHADADVRRQRARHLQRASLSLRARHEHLHRRVRSRDLGARGARQGRRGGEPQHLRAGVRRRARRPPARLQQVDLAQLSMGVERSLVLSQPRADRRRAAHRPLLHRLGHAARHRGCAGARQGAGGGARRPAAGLARYEASRRPIAREAGRGLADVGRLVRPLRRAHAPGAARSGHELHHAARAASTTTGCGRCRRGSWRATMRAPERGGA